jgi:phosphopantothenoylcysteine decarboxylase/phosphopantothenate--cysteine ligase
MNLAMWSNPATQHNCQILNQRGIMLWGPGTGYQACGEVGAGRMLEAADLAERAKAFLLGAGHILEGKRVVLTAGPTREAIDPVRYITNRSSGRMGYAVAAACARQGAKVTLVSGPVNLPTPSGVDRIEVETALQMHHEVMQLVPECDIFIATAAVADFRVALASEQKMKKSGQAGEVSITLVHNPDILAEVAAMAPAPFTVGFAAETENVAQYAKTKLVAKKLDMIAANQVGGELGFDSVENALQVYWPDGEKALPRASKEQLALQLVEMIKERYDAKTQTQNS